MIVGVLGAGLMGKEAATDLVKSPQVEKVIIGDLDVGQTEMFAQKLQNPKLEVRHLDANDDESIRSLMKECDVVVNALFYTFNQRVAELAIELGVNAVDLGGHIGGATDYILNLDEKAKAAGVTLIPDLGVAPGMINILAGHGAKKLDKVSSIKLYVGGIPVEPEGIFKYNLVFSLDGVFDHYTDKSHVIRNGEMQEVDSLSEIEPIHFDGFDELEAFHTAGGTSTLGHTFAGIDTLEYKTIRYKGHAEKFKLLVDLGLTNKETMVNAGGNVVSAREVLREVLTPQLRLGDKKDAVLLRVIVEGFEGETEKSYMYELVTTKDELSGTTAMARATANTISVVAQMVGNGTITSHGVYPPELVVPGDLYMREMANRGVEIKEYVKSEQM
ncbi:saccharopine dehydrogenase [Chryseomicrobium excrementi]|uniref:Saccharopine dehydrogenase n=1 Tax=Chryseomicrobium excrementi TaxID=2041346 RepID=A0A2M9EZX8_9BACL|nr:saccharopine dehydrogenase C-terminal domain-containing protein [Chryseomicrobium excrementi]PJK16767.1 saccharopine dehydrogenase [Chryseomicrobium excrementi]